MQHQKDVELISELLNRRPANDPVAKSLDGDLPKVPPPPMFRPQTMVIGDKRLNDAVENIFRLAPELRGRSPLIADIPTPSYIQTLLSNNELRDLLTPEHYDKTNIAGQFNPLTREIYSTPTRHRDPSFPAEETLGHEFGHLLGYKNATPNQDALSKALLAVFQRNR